jgi:hypothetical protein
MESTVIYGINIFSNNRWRWSDREGEGERENINKKIINR